MKHYYSLAVFFLFCLSIFSQVPPHDDIQNAINISSLPYSDTNVQTQNAVYNANVGQTNGCNAVLNDVYYRYVPTEDMTLNVNLSNGYSQSYALIFESSQEFATSDSQLTYVPSSICAYNSGNTANLLANKVYYILVSRRYEATNINFYNPNAVTNIVNIPDANFKTALLNHTSPVVDVNDDGEIQEYEALFVDGLFVPEQNISDLTGIEAFINLERLICLNNNLTELDLSSNLELKFLDCSYNNLTNLNISQNVNLEMLTAWGFVEPNNLDFSQNINLKDLSLISCSLSSIDVSPLLNLERLRVGNNALESIDLSSNLNLKSLSISNNNLSTLDITNNELIENLYISDTNISTIDLANNLQLKYFSCGALSSTNPSLISALDLTQNAQLEYIYIRYSNVNNLDLSQNINLKDLTWIGSEVVNIDLSNNINLTELALMDNQLTALDLSQNTQLETLVIRKNQISNLDLSGLEFLFFLHASFNPFTTLDLSQNTNLTILSLNYSLLNSLDLSNNMNLVDVYLAHNQFLNSINFKNNNNTLIDGSSVYTSTNSGVNSSYMSNFKVTDNPSLQTVCVDDVGFATTNFIKDATAIFVEDCTITNVNYNIIEGIVSLDDDNNGCDTNDINVPNQLIKVTDGVNDYGTFTNSNGQYAIDVVENTYTTTVENLPSYVTAMPNSFIDTFTGYGTTEIADFCLTANQGNINDVNVVILPTNQARPGFLANYQLVIESTSILPVAGEVTFNFNNGMQDFVNANPSENTSTSNSITFTYSDLQPFEIRTIDIVMNTFTPPTVNGGELLNFTATITPINEDQNPNDNIFVLEQVVVNSYDPNDKTVLQGSEIGVEKVDEYLNYIIRFQNTGTASAINVVITDQLDNDLDWTTLKPVSSSDSYHLRVINGDFLEFKFENINLPAQIDDDSGSQGFVAFKIKPKPEVTVGDFITGRANIYFDYNTPITTNRVSTEVVATLSVSEAEMFNDKIRLYPNPVTNALRIKSNSGDIIESVLVYNISGQLLLKKNGNIETIDLTAYEPGIYFVKLITNKGEFNNRIIKK